MGTSELKLLREVALAEKIGISRETLRKIRREDKSFPRPRTVVGDVYGWLSNEVDQWLLKRPEANRPY